MEQSFVHELVDGRRGWPLPVSSDAVRFRCVVVVFHGRGVHSPDGAIVVAAVRSGVRRHRVAPPNSRFEPRSQYASGRTQHGAAWFIVSCNIVGFWDLGFDLNLTLNCI